MFNRDQVEDIYNLSPMQLGMLYHSIRDDNAQAYFEQMNFTLQGDIKVGILEKSFQMLIQRYGILRTVFIYENVDRPLQVVLKHREAAVTHIDLSNMQAGEQEERLRQIESEDRERGFDLTRDVLMRMILVKLDSTRYRLIWSHHHILLDGWCFSIIVNDFFQLYTAQLANAPAQLGPVYPYSHYIKWLETQDMDEALEFWKGYLADCEQRTVLTGQEERLAGENGYDKGELVVSIDKEITAALTSIAKEHQVTLNHIVQSIWGILLARYSGTEDVVYGSVVSGRSSDIPGIEKMVGLFINTIPVRIKAEEHSTFDQLVRDVKWRDIEAQRHDYISLAQIQASSPLKQDMFDILYVFQNYPVIGGNSGMEEQPGLGFAVQETDTHEQTNYNLTFMAAPGEEIVLKMTFNSNVYSHALIKQLLKHFVHLSRQVAADPTQRIGELEIITEAEKRRIAEDFNATQAPYPKEKTVVELFEEQVKRLGEQPAVIYGGQQLSYRELDERSSQLAHALRSRGVGRDMPVAVMAERSAEMIVCLLGILKAGGAYVPIDPAYPQERIRYMLEDSCAKWLLLPTGASIESTPGYSPVLTLSLQDAGLQEYPIESPPISGSPHDLAYVIYTSGSTGRPKGVMIEHQSIVRLVKNTNFIDFTETHRILQTGSIVFDASTLEIWGALLNGGELYLEDQERLLSPQGLKEAVGKHQITTMFLTTPLFHQLLEQDVDIFGGLKLLMVGGDALSPVHANKLRAHYSQLKLVNGYGPTENTTFSTTYTAEKIEGSSVPIGQPIANSTAYVMNASMQLQPIGVAGELCVGGDGLARGYLNNPELTSERFVPHPLIPGERLYRTGDLAKWTAEGNLLFLGRLDHQVKIRGYRIEPGEVAEQLRRHEAIKEAYVRVCKEEQSDISYLCAYYAADREFTGDEARSYLAQYLPDYMMPSRYIQVDQLPLTINGKVDTGRLPEPGPDSSSKPAYIAPRTDIETALARIWEDVLGVSPVGIHDHFFQLGGHSLSAMTVIAGIHKQLNRQIPLKLLFEQPTIEGLARALEQQEQQEFAAIAPAGKRAYYPVSAAQRRMYVVSQLENAKTSYNMPNVLVVEGQLDIRRLEDVFQTLVQRHEAFRTGFEMIDGQLVQKIQEQVELKVEELAVDTAHPSGAVDLEQEKAHIAAFIRPFDLSQAPLLRVGMIRRSEQEHVLLIDMHHIISDGVSMTVLTEEFSRLYAGKPLPELRIQYKDYAVWQQEQQGTEQQREQETYWLETFSGELPVLSLPTDYPRPAMQQFEGAQFTFDIGPELSAKLFRLMKAENTTLYMVLLAAYNVLLSKYSGQEDIIVGTVAAGRTHADLESVIGMFVNTLPIRNYPKGSCSFREFLQQVKENGLKAFEHQAYPFEELVERLELPRDLSRNPLFDTLFGVQNLREASERTEGLEFRPYGHEERMAKFDLTMTAWELEEGIQFELEYSTHLFHADTIRRMAEHYKQVLEQIAERPEQKLSALEIITEAEKRRITEDFNATQVAYPKDKTVIELFEEQAERLGEQPAVIYGGQQLSYRELDERSSQLAHALRSRGVGRDMPVAVMAERSAEMIVCLLGILKAGGAYVPIDPAYPQERTRYMLEDSGAKWLLLPTGASSASTALAESTPEYSSVLTLSLQDAGLQEYPVDRPAISASPHDLAYVIYTSGSTGRPKGVMIEHQSIVRLVKNTNFIDFTEPHRILQTGSIVFDASTLEIWGALLNGGELYLEEQERLLSPQGLKEVIGRHQITTMFLTTPLFHQLLKQDADLFDGLKLLMVGGDILSPADANKVRVQNPQLKMLNVYGPTENTTFSTSYPMDRMREGMVPIGQPIANSTAYVMNASMQLQPIGVAGELCVGGDGLARGYLNNPELTSERFVPHPLIPGERLYRTGDLAKWTAEGNLLFLGRLDHQVKIRGYRIEPGEVAEQLRRHEAIKEAYVRVCKEEQSDIPYLCAYYAADREFTGDEARSYLAQYLPDYMMPSRYIQVDQLPLTINGKVDTGRLPEPGPDSSSKPAYIAPRTDIETALARIWEDVLGVSPVGIHDHFFQLGGHSLSAMTVIAGIHKQLNRQIPLKLLFEQPTIEGLARALEQQEQQEFAAIAPAGKRAYYPVSAAQRRMYVVSQLENAKTSYNMPNVLVVEGQLDIRRLEDVFQTLVQRHEAFRTGFEMIDGQLVQKIQEQVELKVEELAVDTAHPSGAVDSEQEKAHIAAFIRPFDFSQAPLFRVGLMRWSEQRHVLMLDMHHIISDGASMTVLTEEFSRLYAGKPLPELRIQYKDYAVWQQEQQGTEQQREQETYWLETFSGELPVLSLPTDYPRPAMQQFEGAQFTFDIGPELSAKLFRLMKAENTTLYMVLLAAYNVLLSKYSGQEDIIVGTVAAGRTHADLESVIGMFVNTLPIRNYPKGSCSFREFLQQVKENGLKAFEHQAYPFEELVERLELPRDLSRNPLFDTLFGVQNLREASERTEGLEFRPYGHEERMAKFDLTMTAWELEEGIQFELEYSTHLFHADTIRRMAEHYKQVLEQIAERPEQKLSALEIITEAEKRRIAENFNATQTLYPQEKTVVELFEEQAERLGEQPAVIYGGQQLSYRELDARCNQLARVLAGKGVGPESIVALRVERSFEMVAAILAILKAGGAYLPIDPEFPAERVEYMLEDSGARVLLSRGPQAAELGFRGEWIDLLEPELYQGDASPLERRPEPGHLAYVIYTSGSTGQPKGVMIEHRNLSHILHALQRAYPLQREDRYALKTNYTFDVSVSELFGWIPGGGALVVLPPGAEKEPEAILSAIEAERITHINFVPSMLQLFVMAGQRLERLNQLKYLFVAGEALPVQLADKLREQADGVRLENIYGPTEGTIYATRYSVTGGERTMPIGKPLDNVRAYIVNEAGQLQPPGVPGELCIAGAGLARGYLNRAELTAEKFAANPFEPGERMYRTGDLARWLADGTIEYLGRMDFQVKIKGYRIELGEIAARLREHDQVRDAVVLAREDEAGQPYLCAYVVAEPGWERKELRRYASGYLPHYMVPSFYVGLEELPLGSSGKIDSRRLPEPDREQAAETDYTAPANEKERLLSEIWQTVLGMKRVGTEDNFFELGGDSIKAIQIAAQLKQHGYKLEMKDLYMNPTISALTPAVQPVKYRVDQSEVVGDVRLSPVQKWFFESSFSEPHHFNQAMMLFRAEGFQSELVRMAFDKVVEHHDALRIIFLHQAGHLTQVNRSAKAENQQLYTLTSYDISEDQISLAANELQSSLNIHEGPLIRLGLFHTEAGDHLLLAIHHLLIDGVSWRIVLEDLEQCYQQALEGSTLHLPDKTSSYRDWTERLYAYANSSSMHRELDYWRSLANLKLQPLPKQRLAADRTWENTRTLSIQFSEEETDLFLRKAPSAYNTEPNDLLLAALGITLHAFTGYERAAILLEGHGREELFEELDITRTVGWFTTMYPVVLDMSKVHDLAYHIKNVKETLRSIPNKGIGYGLLNYLTERTKEQDQSLAIAPDISFNYLGQFDGDIDKGQFVQSPLSSGSAISPRNKRECSLDISGLVLDHKLTMNFSYHQEEYSEQQMIELLESCKKALLDIIRHCAEKEGSEATPSDLGHEDLSVEDLLTITDKIQFSL
ncbi:non-ribosomal peptide synthetase [Paenibacillus ihumii]|uniref:non-ribosomal peptide synthetase n=1 Tax=Paenibacillus ihumii TaxID=687436 RepID=UPI0006D7FA26|nr:non-ribosomal peptide synthetase [Paenibacillus ihumii]